MVAASKALSPCGDSSGFLALLSLDISEWIHAVMLSS